MAVDAATSLRQRLSRLIRSSFAAACSLPSRSMATDVQEPVFLSSSRRHPHHLRLAETGHPYPAGTSLDGRACPPASSASPKRRAPACSSSDLDLFSSSTDGGEEDAAERLRAASTLSSRSLSFSSDSSGLYYMRPRSRRRSRRSRRSGFRPVVTETRDPYGDFRRSMAEVVAERRMVAPAELQGLLAAYLALNSGQHHEAILRAFSDVCEALLGW